MSITIIKPWHRFRNAKALPVYLLCNHQLSYEKGGDSEFIQNLPLDDLYQVWLRLVNVFQLIS